MDNSNVRSFESLTQTTTSAFQDLGVGHDAALLMCISGGIDSVILTHVLLELRDKRIISKFHLAHINHKLRGEESERDMHFVESFGKEHKIPTHIHCADTLSIANEHHQGIEETARKIRYQFFQETAEHEVIPFIITAHNANDNAETMIINMVRGGGLKAIKGIPATRKLGSATIVRPWLSVPRSTIEAVQIERDIPYRTDSSNSTNDFQRNRVRHEVMPALRTALKGSDIVEAFARLSRNAAELDEYIDREAALLYRQLAVRTAQQIRFDITAIVDLPNVLRHAIISLACSELAAVSYRLSEKEMLKIERVVDRGGTANLRFGIFANCIEPELILFVK